MQTGSISCAPRYSVKAVTNNTIVEPVLYVHDLLSSCTIFTESSFMMRGNAGWCAEWPFFSLLPRIDHAQPPCDPHCVSHFHTVKPKNQNQNQFADLR